MSTRTEAMAVEVGRCMRWDSGNAERELHLMSRLRCWCPAARQNRRGDSRAAPIPCPRPRSNFRFADTAAAPLAERLRPKTLDEVIGQQHLLGPGKPLARRVRVGAAALDDPVGPARRRQDDAGAPDGRRLRGPVHRHVGGARRRQGHPRGGRARAGGAHRRPGAPSSSSTRCTASTRASRTPSCRTSSRAFSPSSARPPRTRRSRSTRRCCRARPCTC